MSVSYIYRAAEIDVEIRIIYSGRDTYAGFCLFYHATYKYHFVQQLHVYFCNTMYQRPQTSFLQMITVCVDKSFAKDWNQYFKVNGCKDIAIDNLHITQEDAR